MSKTIEEIIKDYTKGRISGVADFNEMIDKSLFQPIEHVKNIAERYAQSKTEAVRHLAGVNSELKKKTQELQEQNAELVEMLETVLSHYEDVISGDYSPFALRSDIDKATELIAKHNHLNKKP